MDECYHEAIEKLRDRMREADHRGQPDANACALATAGDRGQPAVRMIYLQFTEEHEPIFFVNGNSGKGRDLEVNPHAAVCFFWPQLQEQAILEGGVTPLPEAEADRYWRQRSRDSALAAWVSRQDLPEGDTEEVRRKVREVKRQFDFESVPRPRQWVAYRLDPERIEFWVSSWRRLSGRQLYRRDADGRWTTATQEP